MGTFALWDPRQLLTQFGEELQCSRLMACVAYADPARGFTYFQPQAPSCSVWPSLSDNCDTGLGEHLSAKARPLDFSISEEPLGMYTPARWIFPMMSPDEDQPGLLRLLKKDTSS